MSFDEVGLGPKEALAASRSLIDFTGSEKCEALSESVLHPLCGPAVGAFYHYQTGIRPKCRRVCRDGGASCVRQHTGSSSNTNTGSCCESRVANTRDDCHLRHCLGAAPPESKHKMIADVERIRMRSESGDDINFASPSAHTSIVADCRRQPLLATARALHAMRRATLAGRAENSSAYRHLCLPI